MNAVLPPKQLEASWQKVLDSEWNQEYLVKLGRMLAKERSSSIAIYPPSKEVFTALNVTPFEKVKVVILGQDPYHGPGQAHGLCFSVPKGVAPPPSLKNIFKEIQSDIGNFHPTHGCLEGWAKQGVLLLNTVLTVREGSPGSHAKWGWEIFTDACIHALAQREDPVIFVLWGKSALEKCRGALSNTNKRHFILTAPHPSPLSAHRGFFGCRHFSKINDLLKRMGKEEIAWSAL